MKLPLRGGPATTLASGLDRPRGIAVDATSVYFSNTGSDTLMKVPLAGGSATVVASGSTYGSIVVGGSNLYWPSGGQIMKVPVTGGDPTAIVTGQNQISRIALDATAVYWTDLGTSSNNFTDGTIMKMSLQGGAPTALASGRSNPTGIAVDSTSVYWTEWIGNGSLMKVARDGGTPVALVTISDGNLPHLVAVDGTNVYWTVSDSVRKTPIAGGETTLVGNRVSNPMEIVVDSKSVYWSTLSSANLMKATPK